MAKWLALAALAGMLGAAAQASPPEKEILVSNSEGGTFLDFIVHVLTDAYESVGARAVVKIYPAARSIEMANEGVTDAESLRGPGLDRDFPNLIRVPEPVLTLEYHAYTLGKPLAGEGWDAVRGKRLCVNLGEKLIDERTRNMPRELAHGTEAALKMLKAGRCDVVVAHQFAWLAMERSDLGTFCSSSFALETFPLYHYINRRHADLVSGLTAALHDMREDGRLDRYFAADPDHALLEKARAKHDCALIKGAAHP